MACGCSEWVSRDVTNALPTTGVGNESKCVHTPKNHEGEVGGRTETIGGPVLREQAVGGKPPHLEPLCNYILIMHIEAS